MSPAGRELRQRIADAVDRARKRALAAVALGIGALIPGTLLVAWAAGRWPAGPGPLVLLALVGLIAAGAGYVLGRRWLTPIDDDAVAAAVEAEGPLPDGSLRSVLELGRSLPAGVSPALLSRTEAELQVRLAGAPAAETRVGRQARGRRNRALVVTLALTALTVVVGLASPERARAAWTPLLRPVAHLRAPVLPPLAVSPGDVAVDRGQTVAIEVGAPLRTAATLHWRAIGDVPGRDRLAVVDGDAVGVLGPVVATTEYWVTAPDGAVSDTFRAEPRDPLLVSRLAVDAVYPSHTGLDADHWEGDVPALRIPAGTLLRIRGSATRPLASAVLRGTEGDGPAASIDGPRFTLDWRPEGSGAWEWRVTGSDGSEGAGASLEVELLPDAAPEVRITLPGRDTLMPGSLRQPVVADAVDDYGVASARMVLRREGGVDSLTIPFQLATGAPRQLLRGVLDASSMGLVPGDAVEYYVAVTDNARTARVGRSEVYTLRLPSMRGLRDQARTRTETALEDARSLAEQSRSVEEATRDLSRSARNSARAAREGQQSRAGQTSEPGEPGEPAPLSFDDAAEAREVLDENRSMLSEVEALRDRMTELQRAVEEAGLEDPELQRRMDELRELYERVATPEMREAVEQLQQAVESLDAEAVQDALEQLAQQQAALREQLEQSLDMLRRMAAEQELTSLARDAEELATQQEGLAEAVDGEDPRSTADRAGQQEELASRAERLSESLEALRQELEALEEAESASGLESAGEAAGEAAAAMQAAREALAAEDRPGAARAGGEAAEGLQEVTETLDGARDAMSQARARAARETVRQATEEALALAEREDGIRRALEQAQQRGGLRGDALQELRAEQAALQEGLEQLGRNLSEAGQRTALIDRQVGQAVEQARSDMQRALEGLEGGSPQGPIQATGDAVESLNQLALSLIEDAGRIQQAQEGGEGMQQAMQQLSQLAQDQGTLNGQLSALAPMELARQALARQLEALAERQQGIAEEVGRVGEETRGQPGEDAMLGDLEALAAEAEAIAWELAGGRLDPEVRARQERLFHRLLDAGRSLEQEETSEERVGERAGLVRGQDPAALDPDLLDAGLRYPLPTAEQLRAFPPGYRALILEYFQRLNRPSQGTGTGSGGDG